LVSAVLRPPIRLARNGTRDGWRGPDRQAGMAMIIAASAESAAVFTMQTLFRNTSQPPAEDWYVVGRRGQDPGAAWRRRSPTRCGGKRKPGFYTPTSITADFIVVIKRGEDSGSPATKRATEEPTGAHSGYPGGIKSRPLAEILLDRSPEEG